MTPTPSEVNWSPNLKILLTDAMIGTVHWPEFQFKVDCDCRAIVTVFLKVKAAIGCTKKLLIVDGPANDHVWEARIAAVSTPAGAGHLRQDDAVDAGGPTFAPTAAGLCRRAPRRLGRRPR